MALSTFKELEDRYEKELSANSEIVLVSVDKNEISGSTDAMLNYIITNVVELTTGSINFFEQQCGAYDLPPFDDLSDPQVMLNEDSFSIYWSSDKGEGVGAAVIGIDYYWPQATLQGLTIGD